MNKKKSEKLQEWIRGEIYKTEHMKVGFFTPIQDIIWAKNKASTLKIILEVLEKAERF